MTGVDHGAPREDVGSAASASEAAEVRSVVNRPPIVTAVALWWLVVVPVKVLALFAFVGFGDDTWFDIAVFFAACTPPIVAGIGLWKVRRYGRVVTLICALPMLGSYRTGTALATFWLWYFTHRGTRLLFSREPPATLTAEERRDLTWITQRRMWLSAAHWALVVLRILAELNLIDLGWVPAPGKHTSGR